MGIFETIFVIRSFLIFNLTRNDQAHNSQCYEKEKRYKTGSQSANPPGVITTGSLFFHISDYDEKINTLQSTTYFVNK